MNAPAPHAPTLGLHGPAQPEAPPRAGTFNPWPLAIIATFVVFITGTISLVVLSARDRTDLVAPDYYEQEIRYQTRIDQLHRTEPFAGEIKATFNAQTRQMAISLPAQHAAAGITGDIQLYRPNHSSADQSFAIATSPEGLQDIPADLQPGLWRVRLHWKVATEDFYADRSLIVSRPAGP